MAGSESSLLLPWQPQAATMVAEMQFPGWLMPGVVTAGAEGSRGGLADAWGGGPSRRGTAAAHAAGRHDDEAGRRIARKSFQRTRIVGSFPNQGHWPRRNHRRRRRGAGGRTRAAAW